MKRFFGAFLFVLAAAPVLAQAAGPRTRAVEQAPATRAIQRPPIAAVADAAPPAADACVSGFVWREAFPGDHVCVDPAVRAQAAEDNRLAISRRAPGGGPYGVDTCRQGFVWRGARPSDHVCVTPSTRDQAAADNRAAASRIARSRTLTQADARIDRNALTVATGTPNPPGFPFPPPRPTGGATATRGFDENGEPYIDERMADGSIRRQQRNGVTIIKPNGDRQFYPDMVVYSSSQPPTPPQLPEDPTQGRAWIARHNETLFSLIGQLVNNDQAEMQRFTTAETKAAGTDVFKQIEYRTRVLGLLAKP